MMMDLDTPRGVPYPVFNQHNYHLLQNESGGTSNNGETGGTGISSDGMSHPLNHLLRDLDESGASMEYSQFLSIFLEVYGIKCYKFGRKRRFGWGENSYTAECEGKKI